MRLYLSLALCFELGSATLVASHATPGRLAPRAVVTQEILDVPNNIPQGLLEKGDCVIVLSSMTKAALGVGGDFGHGVMVKCPSGRSFHGWVAPRCIRVTAVASACSPLAEAQVSSSAASKAASSVRRRPTNLRMSTIRA